MFDQRIDVIRVLGFQSEMQWRRRPTIFGIDLRALPEGIFNIIGIGLG